LRKKAKAKVASNFHRWLFVFSRAVCPYIFMNAETDFEKHSPNILDHRLNEFFPELLKFESIEETEKSEVYRKIKPDVERILNAVVQENYALAANQKKGMIAALAWNIERGNRFEGIVEALKNHERLRDKDLLLLTELDYGMARSQNRFVAQDLAKELKLNYAFAPCYIALQKGSGVEEYAAGENTKSLHGLAMFSRYAMKNVHAVQLPNGKDKMFGKEKRLGYLRALVADIEHPLGIFRAVTLHLDAHSSRRHRQVQMKIVLDHLDALATPLPTVIGGDWNTTTFNAQSANRAIAGYFRRVAMGVKNVTRNHYPFPDRYFERGLFQELERRGYDYKNLNERGAGTLHYDVQNAAYNMNLGDWVPRWCFPFIFWAARQVGGRVSARLDWFAGKRIEPVGKPQTVGDLVDAENVSLSDHDAIALDFTTRKI
jgi:endonuclease/exonuclease/phosphatase family metal-dependent hydrolase